MMDFNLLEEHKARIRYWEQRAERERIAAEANYPQSVGPIRKVLGRKLIQLGKQIASE